MSYLLNCLEAFGSILIVFIDRIQPNSHSEPL